MPASEIQKIRPPIAIEPFPPRFGYRTTPIGIREIIHVDRFFPDRRTSLSGAPTGYEATSRPSMGYQ